MNRRERTLLAQIEQDVLDDTKPLAGTLRKCVILGGHANSAALRDWAQRELRGYNGVDLADVPPYRIVAAPVRIDAMVANGIITGQQISPEALPDFARDLITNELPLRMGIGELEAATRRIVESDTTLKLSLPQAAELVRYMNHDIGNPRQQITELYWAVAAPALMGVIDQVRTALADLTWRRHGVTPPERERLWRRARVRAPRRAVQGIHPSAGAPARLPRRREGSRAPLEPLGRPAASRWPTGRRDALRSQRSAAPASPRPPPPPATQPTTTAGQTRRTRGSLSTHQTRSGV